MEVMATRYGALIASRHDVYVGRSLIEYGEFSEGEVELFRQFVKPSHIVCDVGANIGAHTLAFARLARHVHAYEPHPFLYCAVCGMVALNELPNVSAHNVGCYSRDGVLSYPPLDFAHDNNLGAGALTKFDGVHAAKVIRLTQPCDFLKVDVEGMELEVLRGAVPMIREKHPVLYVEADREDKFAPLVAFIRELGYFPYWHTPRLFNPRNHAGKSENVWGEDIASINIVAFSQGVEGLQKVEGPLPIYHQSFAAHSPRLCA